MSGDTVVRIWAATADAVRNAATEGATGNCRPLGEFPKAITHVCVDERSGRRDPFVACWWFSGRDRHAPRRMHATVPGEGLTLQVYGGGNLLRSTT